jgi:hypothetical protein
VTPGQQLRALRRNDVDPRVGHGGRRLGVVGVERAHARAVGVRDGEAGIRHAERAEDARGEELVQRLAGDDLDDPPHHVGGDRVVPLGAGLEEQWQPRPHVARRGEVVLGRRVEEEARRAIRLVDRVGGLEAVGEARGVGEQVPHEHRLGGRDGDRRRGHPHAVDAQVAEGGDELRHRVEERKRPLLVEHHRRDRRDRLGHRVDAPDRVGLHRQPGLRVAMAARGHVGDPAPARDHELRALEAPVGHEAVEVGVEPRETLGIEPDLLRLDFRCQRSRGRHFPSFAVATGTRPSLRDAGTFSAE